METFGDPRPLVENALYGQERRDALAALQLCNIDEPVRDLVAGFNSLPCCFTLQSCYGHFLYSPDQDKDSLQRLPAQAPGSIRYRIAYVAFCVENSKAAEAFCGAMWGTAARNPAYFQFGSPDWFWERNVNSYALQVEPRRFMHRDDTILEPEEALHVQEQRDVFFGMLAEVLAGLLRDRRAG